jgi:hypothetical protein
MSAERRKQAGLGCLWWSWGEVATVNRNESQRMCLGRREYQTPPVLFVSSDMIVVMCMRRAASYVTLFCSDTQYASTVQFCDKGGHAFRGVGLRPFACTDCGFESRWGHGCLSHVSVVCSQVDVSDTGRSLVQSFLPCVCVLLNVIGCYRNSSAPSVSR